MVYYLNIFSDRLLKDITTGNNYPFIGVDIDSLHAQSNFLKWHDFFS